MIKKLTDRDKKDWEKFVNSKDKIKNKDSSGFKINETFIEKTIDLHGYSLEEANNKINKFIEKCYLGGVNKINIITGKGNRSQNKENPYISYDLGILKYAVPDYIKNNSDLMKVIKEIDFISVNDPTLGSFHIFLKKK